MKLRALFLVSLLSLVACSKDELLIKPSPLPDFTRAVDLERAWSAHVGAGGKDEGVVLVPAVTGNAVYTVDAAGDLVARARSDGHRLWRRSTGEPVGAGIVAAYNQLFIGTREGEVVAFSAEDGKTLWRASLAGEVLSLPAVNGDALAVNTSDGHVTLLDRVSGNLRWTYDGGAPSLSLRAASHPLLLDDAVLAGLPSGMLVALERATGQVIWERRIAEPNGKSELDRLVDIAGDFVLREDRIYVATYQGRLVALDLHSGQFAWQLPLSTFQPVAVDADNVYAVDADGRVVAVRAADGVVLWRLEALLGRHVTGAAVVGNWLMVGDFQGWLHVIRRTDGVIVGRRRLDHKGITEPPVVDDGSFYALGRGGRLAVLQVKARDGAEAATPPAAAPVSPAPSAQPVPAAAPPADPAPAIVAPAAP